MVADVEAAIADYRLDLAAHSLYEFLWNEYCDWYLELSKPALQTGTAEQQNATRHTLLSVLEITLRTLHPFMPFITEEIWQRVRVPLGIEGKSIMLQPWPAGGTPQDAECMDQVEWLKSVLQGIRRIRSELNLAPSQALKVEFQAGGESDRQRFAQFEGLLGSLGKVESFHWVDDSADTSKSAVALVGELKVLIPLAGLVDVQAELQRIEKLMARERAGLKQSRAKMDNRRFVDNAPESVVEQERQRLADHEANLSRLVAQLAQLEKLRD